MKFFIPLALFAAAGVSAQSVTEAAAAPSVISDCDADYIVSRCLESENDKVSICETNDWECLCAAYEAIATCYNNCPNDTRAAPAKNQVDVHCRNASLYGTKTTKKTSTVTATSTSDSAITNDPTQTGTATETAEAAENTGAAVDLARNTGSLLFVVAGVVAALF